MTETPADRLTKCRIAAGFKTQTSVAERFGWSLDTYKSHESGRREFAKKSEEYARAFKTTPEYLMYGVKREDTVKKVDLNYIEVIAPVQAGEWRESVEYPEDDREKIPVPEEYAGNDNIFAVRVVGDSMNRKFPESTILICINPYQLNSPIMDGDCVIVQRVRNGEYETTVKCLSIEEKTGRAFLMPSSDNPAHQAPIIVPWPYMGDPCPSTGMEKVEIMGVVLDSIKKKKLRDI